VTPSPSPHRLYRPTVIFAVFKLTEVISMTSTEATSEIFLTAFRALKKQAREAILEKLLKDKDIVED